jgi:hypothetical protein
VGTTARRQRDRRSCECPRASQSYSSGADGELENPAAVGQIGEQIENPRHHPAAPTVLKPLDFAPASTGLTQSRTALNAASESRRNTALRERTMDR